MVAPPPSPPPHCHALWKAVAWRTSKGRGGGELSLFSHNCAEEIIVFLGKPICAIVQKEFFSLSQDLAMNPSHITVGLSEEGRVSSK